MKEIFPYDIYGLRVNAFEPLPGLLSARSEQPADLTVAMGEVPVLDSRIPRQGTKVVSLAPANGPVDVNLVIGSDRRWFRALYVDSSASIVFTFDQAKGRLDARWTPLAASQNIRALLLHPLLAYVARLRGLVCLHANVIVVNGQAIAIMGKQGAGKSTTSAGLYHLGAQVLADDVAALTEPAEPFKVQPGVPRLRLDPDTATTVCGENALLEPIGVPYPHVDNKVYLGPCPDSQQHIQPLPLAAIYVLDERQPDLKVPVISPLSSADGLPRLLANSYAPYLLDRASQAHEFHLLGRLATKVPIREVQRPDDLARVLDTCEAILEDVYAL